jgi:aldehyde dehydrogenase (NAD+)
MYDAEGRGFDQSKELLRIVNDAHFAACRRLLDDARAKGARVAVGGETRAADRYVAPTVLTGVTEDMLVMQEEIFAPILPVITWRERGRGGRDRAPPEQAARALCLLQGPRRDRLVSRAHQRRQHRWSITISFSQGPTRDCRLAASGPPGRDASAARRAFREFSNARSVVEQPLGLLDTTFNFPPYSKTYRKLIEKALG